MEPDLKRNLQLLIKIVIVLLGLVTILVAVKWVLPILGKIAVTIPQLLAPFIVAFLLAVLINPLVTWLQQHAKMNRTWSVSLSLLLVVGGIGGILVAVITRLARELAGLYELVNMNSSNIIFNVTKMLNDIQLAYLRLNLPDNIQASMIKSLSGVVKTLQNWISSTASWLVNIIIQLPEMFIFLLIVVIATFFFAKEWPGLKQRSLALIPPTQKAKASFLFNDLINTFIGFLKAEATLVSITALWFIVGLKIIGVDYALTIGLIGGLLDILPVLGPGTIMIPWFIWELVTGNVKLGIGILVLYVLASAVRQILEPRILGSNIGLHPLVTLFALYVGLKLGGVIGMILAPILIVLVLSMVKAGVFNDIKWFNRHSS